VSAPWIAAFAALSTLVGLIVVVLLGFLRRASAVLEEAEARLSAFTTHATLGGAAPGTQVPEFTLEDAYGGSVSSAELLSSGAVVLFMESGCGPCRSLAASLSSRAYEAEVPLYVILDDSPEGRRFPVPPATAVLYQAGRAASRAFASVSTPQAFAVDAQGVVLDLIVPGTEKDIERLATRVTEGGDAGGAGAPQLRAEASVS
jgi:thiol-disulfide isomerase/thioredoxin